MNIRYLLNSGTSPRVRGKRSPTTIRRVAAGYIPARAGEAHIGDVESLAYTVHPRACGGSRSDGCAECPQAGTSPRVRGKLSTAPG